jgi:protein-tyrosine phosphatase
MSMFASELASPKSTPPTSSSYWVVPGLLLAGAYPGHPDPDEHHFRVKSLVSAGVRTVISLMEPEETDHAGDPFVPYTDLARQLCPEAVCVRHPIRDVSVPTKAGMLAILDEKDMHTQARTPVYVHCWGGVGRTGTVVGCWLLRHRLAEPSDVLDVLMRLRQQDKERRHRMSPETGEQQRFVRQWQETDGAMQASGNRSNVKGGKSDATA